MATVNKISIFSNSYHYCSLLFLFLLPISLGIPISEFYPYGSAHDKTLEQGDDLSTEILLSVPVKFFGENYETIYVNTNGLLSFIYDVPYFSNVEFPLEYPIIAPLYSNVDTTGRGKVYYRESNDSALLHRAAQNVQKLYPYLSHLYEPKSIFITTWDHVGYYNAGTDKVNTFQAVISTDGHESFVELLYADGGIQWMQAINKHGLPEARAQAGIVAPGGRFYTFRGSGTDQVINLDKWTNADKSGMFIFRIGNINETGNVEAPPNLNEDYNVLSREPKSCFEGATDCHSNADCIDQPQGYCCRCQPNYFGNGRSCLEREVARRIFGKLKLFVQDESLEDLDFHGYIVTKDGKIYIAVNNLPENIGYKVQLLFNLDSFVGWLFASPKGDAKNGYMLTGGVVNHTADITFDDNYRVSIKQRYTGLNLFDHIRMEGEVHGTLPDIPRDVQIQMPEFNELYTRTGPGEFRSSSRQEIQLSNGEVHKVTVDQTINFVEYCRSAENDMASMRMESVKNYINYDTEQSILRFASFNKIFKGSETSDDPCIEGRRHCVANSTCLVEGDGFKCVCNSGFRQLNNNLYENGQTDVGCADINECADGTNACHNDAICVNEIGSYSCHCKPGYIGDGNYCDNMIQNEIPPNAVCRMPNDYNTCSCNYGYELIEASNTAGFVCTDVDECSRSVVCPEEADCINLPGNFTCRCRDGYEGDGISYCYKTDPCRMILCPENTYCDSRQGTAQCFCQTGYKGTPPHCSRDYEDREDCSTMSCPEGTSCFYNSNNEPICHCNNGHGFPPDCRPVINDICASDLDCPQNAQCTQNTNGNACNCISGYSWNGQACISSSSSTDNASYEKIVQTCLRNTCWCPPGYIVEDGICIRQHGGNNIYHTTTTPTYPLPDPWEDQCQNEQCHPNAQCIYVYNEQKYKCMCQAGFEGDGHDCRFVELSCDETADYCHFNATCEEDELNGRHICVCKEGYEGDGTTCYQIGQCREDNDCGLNGQCYFNTYAKRYECECAYGFFRNTNNECELEDIYQREVCTTCHEHAICVTRHDDSHTVMDCICKDGYEGDGIECNKKPLGCDTSIICSPYAECIYKASAVAYVCECIEGYEGNGTYCSQIRTCYEEPNLCSPDATCTSSYGKFVCECNDGFYGNGTLCREARKQEEEYLLLNKGRTILQVPFNPSRTNRGRPIYINENQIAIGIAIDCVDGRVYWSDINNMQVQSSKYDGSDFQIFMNSGIKSPEGLAIDWINREIYWTDSAYDKIVAVNLDTKEIRTVASNNLVNPRGITVNPYKRKVYWSDWNRDEPKIEWANLDGSDRQILVREPYIKLPNSLAIDWSTEELCWADAGTKTIECLNVEANQGRTIVKNCSYPYGLAITNDMYYWTDWNTLKLETSSKNEPNNVKSIDLPLGGNDKPYGVVAVTSCP